MKHTRLTFLLLSLLYVTGSYAQGEIEVRHYSTEDGLSQKLIQDIIQDSDGYIWMANRNGLDMFDGYHFKNYKSYPTDQVKLKHNRIVQLIPGNNHSIWCQTHDNRVYLFDTQHKKFINIAAFHPQVKECTEVSRMIVLPNHALWVIGNNGNLWRFDEDHYQEEGGFIHLEQASNPYHGERVNNIVLDDNGNEWVFTDKGYFVHGNQSLRGSTEYAYTTLVGDKLFMVSSDNKLAYYSAQEGLKPFLLPHAGTMSITYIATGSDHELIVTDGHSVTLYNVDTHERSTLTLNNSQFNVNNLYRASDGIVWILTTGQEILRCDFQRQRISHYTYPVFEKKNKSFIHEDEYGQIWMLPSYGELMCYNSKADRFEHAYTYIDGKKVWYDYSQYRLGFLRYLFDRRGNLWQCCDNGFNKVTFMNANYHFEPTRDNSEVRALFIDSKSRIWIADKGGRVEIYDKNHHYIGNMNAEGRIVNDRSTTIGGNVYCIYEDRRHQIWMGSREAGLYVASPEGDHYRMIHLTHQNDDAGSLSANSVFDVREDINGDVWIGTYGGGLNRVTGEFPNFRFITPLNGLDNYPKESYRNVRTLHCSGNGVMMVGTTDGLITFMPNAAHPEQTKFFFNRCEENRLKSLANNDVLHIFESRDGELFVVSFSDGFSKVESKDLLTDHIDFSHFNKENGLPSDIVYAMTENRDGNIWITFETCICRYDRKRNRFETFYQFNGNTNQFISEGTPVIDRDQNLLVGATQGLITISLPSLHKSDFHPPIVFTQVNVESADNNPQRSLPVIDNKLSLGRNERNMNISFAALDYTNSGNLQYAYRLKGVNEDWIYIGNNHSASFVNLPAGDLTLEVKSTNGDGVWTDNVAALHLHIRPTFWETGWAWVIYILAALLAILVVAGILAYIFNLQRKVDFEQQLTNLKLRFFTDISHELRTPLTLITAPVEEVLNHERLSPQGHENMVIAKRNVDRMLRLINQLLDFRKIQNNKMKLYVEQADAVALARHTFDNFVALAKQRAIDFQFIAPSEKLILYTDTDKLEKILFNLLSNAFKYTPDNKRIRLTLESDNDHLLVKVEDEGRGIEVHKIDSLFNRFETVDKGNRKNSTGIGLSLVNELVKMLHGTIEVKSALGQGSTFMVTLPVTHTAYEGDTSVEFILKDGQQQLQQLPTEPAEESQAKETSILVVEDNEELRRFIVNILQPNYQVMQATDGADGLKRIKEEMPDLVISDIMMPNMDGIELIERTRADHDICHTPFIFLSAKTTLEDRIRGLEYGADDYITKPFSASYLSARIAALLKRRSALRDYFMRKPLSEGEATDGQDVEQTPENPPVAMTEYDRAFIERVTRCVEEQIQNADFKIDDIADELKLSRTVFYRKFRSITGLPPKDFVRDFRVKYALRLMKDDSLNISEIAYLCGFSSPQYFSRIFKEVMNCTPSQYKETSGSAT